MKKFQLLAVMGLGLMNLSPANSQTQDAKPTTEQIPMITSAAGLSSLVTISDGYLQKMADILKVTADNADVRSATWDRVRTPLQEAAKLNVEALNWFALPDGTYWSTQNGREERNLSDRAYFRKVMAGQTVLGELVVSKATGKSIAIVAVPVYGKDQAVVGVLGASIYLDKLSERIGREMGLNENIIYYSFNSNPTLGLVWDPSLIMVNPKSLGEEVSAAFDQMLSQTEGVQSYSFRGRKRTVVFRKSDVTGWWYAFGVVKTQSS